MYPNLKMIKSGSRNL